MGVADGHGFPMIPLVKIVGAFTRNAAFLIDHASAGEPKKTEARLRSTSLAEFPGGKDRRNVAAAPDGGTPHQLAVDEAGPGAEAEGQHRQKAGPLRHLPALRPLPRRFLAQLEPVFPRQQTQQHRELKRCGSYSHTILTRLNQIQRLTCL
ncbi:UNVERIFIED_CONTAM: hypothetical protein PYX00_010639 [Menopon gallinae]|uniref:Uncharacterized protein n=1 Tax=Menopon gallinae TaxID=328185 RepID=A0AAW2HGH2_9NEOP